MIGYRADRSSTSEEIDKPHWISYSDLMTSLMILFLVVMVASLTSLSQQTMILKNSIEKDNQTLEDKVEDPLEQDDEPQEELAIPSSQIERQIEIMTFCESMKNQAAINDIQANFNCEDQIIDLGVAGRFASNSYVLPQAGQTALKELVPLVLSSTTSELGEKWLKRVHIQGYTDIDGSYLYNLNLSLKRSEWVMCEILRTDSNRGIELSSDDRILARQLFLAGGVSFNDQLSSKEESRRVEFKLEYYELDEFSEREPKADKLLFSDNTREVCQI